MKHSESSVNEEKDDPLQGVLVWFFGQSYDKLMIAYLTVAVVNRNTYGAQLLLGWDSIAIQGTCTMSVISLSIVCEIYI